MSSLRLVLLLPLVGLSGLLACSDYDLHRPDDKNEGDTGSDPIPPTGTPDIQVEPASLDFGSVLSQCPSAPQTVTITNVGDEILDVYSIVAGGSQFVANHDGTAFQLPAGEALSFEVTFTPEEYVAYDGSITVISNDPDEEEVIVPTAGVGDSTALYEEGFTQEHYESVDVLWVVDNSGSMSEEQNQVQVNFASFIAEFVDLGLDYHLAVVTTDMNDPAQSGRFVGPVITPASADPVGEFLAMTNLGSKGSGEERGMDAVQAALTAPLLSSTNVGFLRDSAALAVIVLSDENDYSNIADASFLSWFEGMKPDPELVTFNAIVGDPSDGTLWDLGGCSDWAGTDLLQAEGGDRYVAMADLTGGIWKSICYEDYNETLAHISLTSAGMVTTWPLSQTPTSYGLIEVYIDGVQWYYSLLDGWTYDATDNSITFHGDAIPAAGAYVLLTYPIEGECSG